MKEQTLHQSLMDVVADEPPLQLDLDVLTSRARRHQARRRTMLGAWLLVVLVVVAAAGLPTVQPHRTTELAQSGARGDLSSLPLPYEPLSEAQAEAVETEFVQVVEASLSVVDEVSAPDNLHETADTMLTASEGVWFVQFPMTDQFDDVYQTRISLTASALEIAPLTCADLEEACRGPWASEKHQGVEARWVDGEEQHRYEVWLNAYQLIDVQLASPGAPQPDGETYAAVERVVTHMLDDVVPKDGYLDRIGFL